MLKTLKVPHTKFGEDWAFFVVEFFGDLTLTPRLGLEGKNKYFLLQYDLSPKQGHVSD